MRTNIVIDDELLAQTQKLTGIKTQKGVVEEALRLLIQMSTQLKVRELRGQLTWEGDFDNLRDGRVDLPPF